MTTRFIDHLLTGDHASLPAANAVPQGTLYSCTDHEKIYQSDGSATWSDWATITGAAPGAHASSHEDGGGDEINVTGLSGLLADPQTPDAHTHPQSEVTDLVTDLGAIDTRVDALETAVAPAAQGTWLASGGGVSLISGLQFLVSAGTGYINAQLITWTQDSVTLDAADGSNDRFDAIIIDSLGNVDKVTGTPSASPELPTVDVLTQLVLTYVLVGTGVTDIPITKTAIYQENTEWTSAQSGGTIDSDSVSEPHAGTKCIEATSAANGHYVEFSDAAMSLADQKQLVFQIKNKASWANQKSITITWYNGTTKIGQSVQLSNGKYGFDQTNTTTYQQIIIPITDFIIPGGAQVTKVRFAVAGGGAAIGWRIDEIYLDASSTVVIVQPVAVASASVSGTVKTDVTVGDPVVYVKESVDLLLAAKAALAGATFTGDVIVPDEAYDATNWDGNLEVPTKNAIRDKIETLGGGYTDEQAQDAVGAMVDDATLEYVDATPLLHVKDAGITPAKASTALKTFQIIVTIGDGVNVISTGYAGDVPVEIDGTITGWTLLADTIGDIVIDSWLNATHPPVVGDTMWGTKPELSGVIEDAATGLSIAIAVGDKIRFNVDSATTVKQVTLSFTGVRT